MFSQYLLEVPTFCEDVHATRPLLCQWWSGNAMPNTHAGNAASVHQCCAPMTNRLAAGRCPISCRPSWQVGNRRSGDWRRTGHASQTIVVYPPTGSTAYEKDEHPAYAPSGVWPSYTFTFSWHLTGLICGHRSGWMKAREVVQCQICQNSNF